VPSIALKRLSNRIGLTLLSIIAVALAVAITVSIPIFAKAISFVMLEDELDRLSATEGHPPFAVRFSAIPVGQYPLSTDQARTMEEHIAQTIAAEVGLPLVAKCRQLESKGVLIRTREERDDGKATYTTVLQDTRLAVLPGVETRLDIVHGEPMSGVSPDDVLEVWIHHTTASEASLIVGEVYQLYDARLKLTIPLRFAGTWRAADPQDTLWLGNPDHVLRRAMLVRESDYRDIVEPLFEQEIRLASWYLILDHSQLAPDNVKTHADGLREGNRVVEQYLPHPKMDVSPLDALDSALKRESDLTVLMFVLSVPVIGFLLSFLGLISGITVRWQRRETAVMISRGLDSGQLLDISVLEAGVIVGLGLPLGLLSGVQLARTMGYTQSFLRFVWRPPLQVSAAALNVPSLIAVLCASLLARLLPVLRLTHRSIITHERDRARARGKPFWQRFYIDFSLLAVVMYAYRRLSVEGTLVPQAVPGEGRVLSDPLLFLVPSLFVLTLSLLLVRLFPLVMRIGDALFALGRRTVPYLALRQLSRQSSEYSRALLLVITALSLGSLMASVATSLDRWLTDQAYYEVGADVYIKQMYNPAYLGAGIIPSDGAWMLPIASYVELPGITHAARVGMYDATIRLSGSQVTMARYVGVDRLDAGKVLFFRPDFAREPLGGLMNRLASREDAVLLSEDIMARGQFGVGDRVPIKVVLVDLFEQETSLSTEFTIVGSYEYFPTVYERGQEGQTAIIGNLDFLFEQVGGPQLHDIWLDIEPGAEKDTLMTDVRAMRVYIMDWVEAREEIWQARARAEHVGTFGMLTVSFLAAAIASGIGLLIHNYASLRDRLSRFAVLRAIGLSLRQVLAQITVEYGILMLYSIGGGTAVGVWAARLFISFFQAADESVLHPPTLIPYIAWRDIGLISGAFALFMVAAQVALLSATLRRGVFQALQLGDQE
jgi:putative ABC transport system permease protein